jgi:hypothetical protein
MKSCLHSCPWRAKEINSSGLWCGYSWCDCHSLNNLPPCSSYYFLSTCQASQESWRRRRRIGVYPTGKPLSESNCSWVGSDICDAPRQSCLRLGEYAVNRRLGFGFEGRFKCEECCLARWKKFGGGNGTSASIPRTIDRAPTLSRVEETCKFVCILNPTSHLPFPKNWYGTSS